MQLKLIYVPKPKHQLGGRAGYGLELCLEAVPWLQTNSLERKTSAPGGDAFRGACVEFANLSPGRYRLSHQCQGTHGSVWLCKLALGVREMFGKAMTTKKEGKALLGVFQPHWLPPEFPLIGESLNLDCCWLGCPPETCVQVPERF